MDELKEQGWYLSDEGYNLFSDSRDVQKIIKKLVDQDLKEIGSGQGDLTQGNVVWQLQKLRNVAAPKSNEESRGAPRMLKLSLTDGQNNYQAIEIEPISFLSLNTPPGTKLLMKKGVLPMSHGIILLKPTHILTVLGGKVANLVEKWEMNKKLAQHTRVRPAEEGGPPPWIPFGKKIVKISEQDKNFKALADKERASKENAEFEAQRKDAIAEAAKQGSKKIFGGGNKQLLDHSVQRIVDQGYSVEQAEYALRLSRNNVERALKSLQRNDNRESNSNRETREPKGKRFEKKAEDGKPSSGRVSLFDFLEDKLPTQIDLPDESKAQGTNEFYNNKGTLDRLESRSTDHATRGGRNQRGGGRSYQSAPRHFEEVKSSKPKPVKGNATTVQYPQHNSTNIASNQRKPPRFQKSQENFNSSYQQDSNYKSGGFNKTQHNNENKNGFAPPPRLESGIDSSYSRNRQEHHQGNSYNNNRYQNHYQGESKPREKHDYNVYNPNMQNRTDASYSSHRNNSSDNYQQNQNVNSGEQNYRNRNQNRNPANPTNGRYTGKETNVFNEEKGGSYNNNQLVSHQTEGSWVWQPGDKCMAKYWEDNRYYNAQVTAVSQRTCVVLFKDFNNFEEVLQIDCIPITMEDGPISQDNSNRELKQVDQRGENRQQRNSNQGNHITTGMEFRRGGGGTGTGTRGYNRRAQHRSTRPLYQPPGQRNYSPPRGQNKMNSES